ncbi:MAG: DUF488 domain-containing protein [Spirochaetes bacterium]|nr:DUF488 domain-containing protein [Spirochaetota bacterium]
MATLYTIGFTKRNARDFFTTLQNNDITTVIDIRINNTSQLSGYTKKEDLEYFLWEIAHIKYIHDVRLAPTKEMLDAIHKKTISWEQYQEKFVQLLTQRNAEHYYNEHNLHTACLLCSEYEPTNCHRRLVAEYFARFYNLDIVHL